jgi:hypothetical protein
MLPMESRDTSVRNVSGIAEKIHLLVDIQKNARKKYCVPIKSVVV